MIKRMQSAECVCMELCVSPFFCCRLCEIIFLCSIYWVEVVGMERKAYWTAFFLLNGSKFQNSEQNLQLYWGWGRSTAFACFWHQRENSWALTIREGCDCWIRLSCSIWVGNFTVFSFATWLMLLDFDILMSRPEPLYDFTSHGLLTRHEITSL